VSRITGERERIEHELERVRVTLENVRLAFEVGGVIGGDATGALAMNVLSLTNAMARHDAYVFAEEDAKAAEDIRHRLSKAAEGKR
jgi:hypothetical protein